MVRWANLKPCVLSSLPETDEIFTSALTEQSRETVLLSISQFRALIVTRDFILAVFGYQFRIPISDTNSGRIRLVGAVISVFPEWSLKAISGADVQMTR
jgi:hypothetical protein